MKEQTIWFVNIALEFGIRNMKNIIASYTGQKFILSIYQIHITAKNIIFLNLLHRMRLLAENCDYMIMILNNENKMNPQLKTAYNKVKEVK